MKKLKEKLKHGKKGITLIALIITIVVLLILAGVSIATLTGDNGLLAKAQETKEENEKAGEKDKIQLAYQAAKMEEYQNTDNARTFEEIFEEELEKNGLTGVKVTDNGDGRYTVTLENGNSYIIDENGNIKEEGTVENPGESVKPPITTTVSDFTGEDMYSKTEDTLTQDENGNPITIPAGFKVVIDSTTNNASHVSEGIVIQDVDENQFVWVPVSDINEMAQCSNADGTCELELVNNEIVCTAHNNNTQIVGKLYATTYGENFEYDTPNTTYNDFDLREPSIVTMYGSGFDVDTENLSIINTILETNYTTANELLTDMYLDYAEMIKSVEKYDGFYISRYEMSKDSNNKAASVEGTPLVNDSSNMWYGLYAYGKTYNTDSVGSSMIWGSQYDAMMRWMYDNGKGTNVKENIGDRRNTNTTTGTVETDIIKNVYDLYGCNFEWTLEAYSHSTRVSRGR